MKLILFLALTLTISVANLASASIFSKKPCIQAAKKFINILRIIDHKNTKELALLEAAIKKYELIQPQLLELSHKEQETFLKKNNLYPQNDYETFALIIRLGEIFNFLYIPN